MRIQPGDNQLEKTRQVNFSLASPSKQTILTRRHHRPLTLFFQILSIDPDHTAASRVPSDCSSTEVDEQLLVETDLDS